jgi:hypothetical protein
MPAIRKNTGMATRTPTSATRLSRVSSGSRTGGSSSTQASLLTHAIVAWPTITPTTSSTLRLSA